MDKPFAREFQVAPSRGDNRFLPGTTLDRILQLVELDERLRLLLSEALGEIELGVRSRFAYEAGKELGSRAFYLEESSYLDITPDLPAHIGKIRRELSRPKLRTVSRYRDGEDLSAVPIWVAIEVVTFGALAKTLWYLATPAPANRTADALGVQRTGFGSTIHSFAVLRNVCASRAAVATTLRRDVLDPSQREEAGTQTRAGKHVHRHRRCQTVLGSDESAARLGQTSGRTAARGRRVPRRHPQPAASLTGRPRDGRQ